MISWFENDLKLVEIEFKMKELKKEFDKDNNEESKDYNKRLNLFLRRKLKGETKEIFREQIAIISNSL